MASAFDVARYLIRLGAENEEPDYLSQLRVQKLLYYTQGWALAALDHPLFHERIEAWKKGPVVASVWPKLTAYDDRGIQPGDVGKPEGLSDEDKSFINSVWEKYKIHSAIGLMLMTHREDPWKDARAGLPASAPSSQEIAHSALRAWFSREASTVVVKGLSVVDAHRAAIELGKERLVSHEEVFASLRKSR